jgi:large subunit ribosomal protein L10
VTYRIAKNTLVKRAAEDAGVDGLDALLTGPTAIAFVTGEPVDAAKALRDFAKDNKALVIKGGYMDGNALSVDEVNRIADLESREVLLAKLAGAMKGNLSKAPACSPRPRRRSPAWPRRWRTSVPPRAPPRPTPTPPSPPTPQPRADTPTPPAPAPPAHQKEKTMAKLSTDELLDAFKDMTLLELSEFVKKFEDTFEVTAAAPVAVAAGRPAAVVPPPRPPRRRTSSTSSSRPRATRRSRSSRSSASSSPGWA